MNRILGLLTLVGAVLCTSCTDMRTSYPKGIEHVVVIGVDGMSSAGLRDAHTPIMDSLIAHGSVTWHARVVLPSVSSPNWASMLHGAGPEQHGITSNDWEPDGDALPPVVAGEQGRFPSIFDVIRGQRPDAETGSVYHWEGFGRLYDAAVVNYDAHYSTPDSCAQAFGSYIAGQRPVFSFIQLDHVDGAGHRDGHMSPGYLASITNTDSLVGVILDGIRRAGIEDRTLVIITSDHGGIGYGHGGESPEEMTVPVVLAGRGVKRGYRIQQQTYIYDIAATAAFALRLTVPYAWIGRPVAAAFDGFDEPANLLMGKPTSEAPTIFPARAGYAQAGGLYIDQPAEVRISPADPAHTVHYTLDGSEPNPESTQYTVPFTVHRTTVVNAKAVDPSGAWSPTRTAYYRIVHSGKGTGLTVSHYDAHGRLARLPDFQQLRPTGRWIAHEFRTDQPELERIVRSGASFALVFEGYLQIDTAGSYQFHTQSDDGSKLYVANQLVVDNDGDHGVIGKTGSLDLTAGLHPVKVEYFNGGGGYWLEAFYAGPGLVKQIIPADRLFLTN